MGADGHLYITDQEEITDFIKKCIYDTIYNNIIKEDIPEYDNYTCNLTDNEFSIQFYLECEEVPDEKIVIKTIIIVSTHYYDIYTVLLDEIRTSLNNSAIPWYAWDRLDDDSLDTHEFINELYSNGKYYTYWDTEAWYNDTLFDFFCDNNRNPLEDIYLNINNSYCKESWYEIFIILFPTLYDFIGIMENNRYMVSTESFQMWT